jgi:membrane-bound lytic murein transglycosylase D
MSNRWTTLTSRTGRAAKQAGARYGVKLGIVAIGAVVAAGMIQRGGPPLPTAPFASVMAPALPRLGLNTDEAVARATSADRKHVLDVEIDHARVAYWIDQFTNRGGFDKSLERMSKYADMITAKLDAQKLPRELIYVAMIESNFNPNARSPVSAVGLWQFMRPTAREFGLTVRGKTDERKNPAKATDAALDYLSSLYDRFGSWYLAAAAYNSGQGTVSRALKQVTGRTRGTDEDFFRILPRLPRETQDYVPKLIAAARVGNAAQENALALR